MLLTADAFGVMPPIAKLTPAQAMYHFLSGYTAKVAGTEKGLVGVQPEFSTCFGAPFLPRHPSVYGNLLRELISAHDVDCWLVNTGWTGGIYGVGRRMPIKVTRTLLTAALDGSLKNAKFRTDPYFGFSVPTQLAGVEPHLLYPQKTWQNKLEFDQTARKLVDMFQKNFVQFESTSRPTSAPLRRKCGSPRSEACGSDGLFPRPPGRFRYRSERRLAGRPGEDVVDHKLIHLLARVYRRRAEMRQQHDVVHRQKFFRHFGSLAKTSSPAAHNFSLA